MEDGSGKSQDFEVLLNDLSSRLSSISSKSESLTPDKNSYMDLKINFLLNYHITYAYKLYQDAKKQPADLTVKSLIKHKCFLERLKPLDNKLKYQLEKISQGNVDNDLKMKPNPQNMDTQLRVNEKPGIYKPPKLQAAIFEDKISKTQRDEIRLKKKLARSSLIKNLKQEFDDNPIEIKTGKNKKIREIEAMQREFEEETFTRVQLSKKEKKLRKKLEKEDDEEQDQDLEAFIKLIKPDKKKLSDSINYTTKKRKYTD
jgi:U3 small nucleolar ribonucleoprotein protein LCP5